MVKSMAPPRLQRLHDNQPACKQSARMQPARLAQRIVAQPDRLHANNPRECNQSARMQTIRTPRTPALHRKYHAHLQPATLGPLWFDLWRERKKFVNSHVNQQNMLLTMG
jgi:hypothetical protein